MHFYPEFIVLVPLFSIEKRIWQHYVAPTLLMVLWGRGIDFAIILHTI